MENNKKQQNFSRPLNSKNNQAADSKRKTDIQTKFTLPRSARRRDQQQPAPRNDQQRNSKQFLAKQRPNVDKRPRARGGGSTYGGNNGNPGNVYSGNGFLSEGELGCHNEENILAAGTGLVDVETADDSIDITDANAVGEIATIKGHVLNPLNVPAKRKNLNHLLNFQYAPRDNVEHFGGGGIYGVFGSNGTGAMGKKHQQQHKYNKEQFLQANFQFVIKSNAKLHSITSPDAIVDWSLIEQINIQTTEEPRCPICLYPPVAAKLTRCGHAYCWPCILHYLALNDKSWRKCPICYEAVHVGDLKSTAILQQRQFNVGDEIKFQLMCRKKGSFFVEKFSSLANANAVERYPSYSGKSDVKPFSKFLIAKRNDILAIIERERAELLADEDTTCPEYVFVQQALNLLNERREHLGELQNIQNKDEDEIEINSEDNYDMMSASDAINNEVNDNFEKMLFEEQHVVDETNSISSDPSVDSSIITTESTSASQQKYYYFYQSVDGQNIFLHPLNVKMLQACYVSLEHAPLTINARILQKECHTMDDDLRRKFTCLGHLPLTCQFAIVEVDLQTPIVTKDVLKLFRDDVKQRQHERDRRDREEKKREKKIAAINDRQMGKLIAKAANLNLYSPQEFPVCGFDFDLLPTMTGAATNSVTTPTKIETKPSENIGGGNNSVAIGTPPGPSYSSVILSQKTNAGVNNAGLFPELSFGVKSTKKHNSNTAAAEVKATPITVAASTSSRAYASLAASSMSAENDIDTFKSLGTTFGDVMEQAIARKKASTSSSAGPVEIPLANAQNGNNAGKTPKSKREKKKMVPLFPFGSGGSPHFN